MGIENVIDIEVDASEAKEGLSAYEVYLKNGGTLSEEEWLESLRGAPGPTGANGIDGKDGKSAYESWLDAGNAGTEEDFINSLKGEKGDTPDLTDYAKIEYVVEIQNNVSENKNNIKELQERIFMVQLNSVFNIDINTTRNFTSQEIEKLFPFVKYCKENPTKKIMLILTGLDNIFSTDNIGGLILFTDNIEIISNNLFIQLSTPYHLSTISTPNRIDMITCNINGIISNDEVININSAQISRRGYDIPLVNDVLTKTNTASFTPTSDYHPATKRYVDNSISYAITDSLGGSY